MKKNFTAILLALLLVFQLLPVSAAGDAPIDITAYLTISQGGELVTDKNGDALAYAAVALSGKASYTLDDVFRQAHETYYDGEDGYASSEGSWGLSIDKLWGNGSYNFGYQVNGGSEAVMGLSHTVEDGDYIDAYIYESLYPDSEAYTTFDKKAAEADGDLTLTLTEAGYDENWNTVFTPCAGAAITVNGTPTEAVTDANGQATVSIPAEGTCVISAVKSKTVGDATVTAIVAPVCVVNDGRTVFNHFISTSLSISQSGKIVTDKNGTAVANARVELYGKESYTLDDVFRKAHTLYYDGEDGYASSEGDYGLAIDTLWGDDSGNFGYQVNGGSEAVMGLSHVVENGDIIDAYTMQSLFPQSEAYTVFDVRTVSTASYETFTLTLREAGYDESFNMVFSPCEGAVITINGEETDFRTDADGKAQIFLPAAGTYLLSAKKSKTVNEAEVTAITAPVCIASASARPDAEIIHAIAQSYAESDLTATGDNLPWIIADMITFESLYPTSPAILDEAQKEACLNQLIADASDANTAADFSKLILAIRALGYDAAKITTVEEKEINLPEKLTALIEAEDPSVTNIYTLPYVILALSQSEAYADDSHIEYLLDAAVESKASWKDTAFGTDGLSPMLAALAPHCDTNSDVKTAVDEAVIILRESQREEDGLIDGFAGYEDASTGLAIWGLSALGISAETVTAGEKSLVDGLLSRANEAGNGFSNAFATEQGFRGLLALQLLQSESGNIYDFSAFPMAEAKAVWAEHCPVTFKVIPEDATVTVEGETAVYPNRFDLEAGSYSYSVSKSGYKTKSGMVTVSAEEASSQTPKTLSVSLTASSTGTNRDISVRVKVMTHSADKCDGKYTYTKNASKYTALADETLQVKKGTTVFDLLDAALAEKGIEYTESSYGYISEINGLEEFDHSPTSGWMFTVGGKLTETGARDTKVTSGTTVIWYYTDDYTKEKGSEKYSSSSSGGASLVTGNSSTGSTAGSSAPAPEKPSETPTDTENKSDESTSTPVSYPDVSEKDWFYEAVQYVSEKGLMQGTGTGFAPEEEVSRAMLVTVLYRLEKAEYKGESAFEDVAKDAWYAPAVAWASENGIVNGYSEEHFGPEDTVTREQMAAILHRYAALKDAIKSEGADLSGYGDADKINDWALESIAWANAAGLITGHSNTTLSPGGTATRAQIATILMRLCETVL